MPGYLEVIRRFRPTEANSDHQERSSVWKLFILLVTLYHTSTLQKYFSLHYAHTLPTLPVPVVLLPVQIRYVHTAKGVSLFHRPRRAKFHQIHPLGIVKEKKVSTAEKKLS
jgi:hypothetical protein